ncbi:hypothetical protein NIES4103_23420 [Nostoc sp. NIES-4103]|nr:hypothetical protein NIES4103_23420 [Nostoc sp. NIES-4103]
MIIAPSTKYLIGLVLALIALTLFAMYSVEATREYTNYDSLNNRWQIEALSKNPLRDPRSDSDQLRPVMNFDDEIIQIDNFEKKPKGLFVGEGWQLVGAVVDMITHNDSKYILYGRRNLRFQGGLWNNVIDSTRSFEDYLVVKRQDNQAEVLINKRLIPTTAEILIGLRQTEDGGGLEVIQNSSLGRPQIIWSYQFSNT